ncbi:membrane permeability protein SanA [Veronia nyctiphanis]|uniref:Membrane permeability protein SanA n=1 Tax=Veronia nyctiphanis TaxID=1278244 RepID=A0A4Q0YYV7_9GAMM|nr:ElyC/SanA/YdcF family protein [Veronia nyctiphanis]RXJ74281.1 membrane permeability protein SanA [Veronia nyctiphanis]
MTTKRILIVVLASLTALVSTVAFIDFWIGNQTKHKIYSDVSNIPKRSIGLVLGTSKYIGRQLNPFYTYRINAAKELFQKKKVDLFLLSGDNAHRSYNEPWTMKRDLLKAQIPESNIYLDYAGFRTLDSVIRAKKVFDVDQFTIITQRFHCERALFIAQTYNIDAICMAVPGPDGKAGLSVRIRETLARAKAILDIYVFDVEPKFLGPKSPSFRHIMRR